MTHHRTDQPIMLQTFYQSAESGGDWRVLRSEGYLGDVRIRQLDGSWVLMENLPPLLRTLLVTDGTVTKVLEAYFWEPVNVRALHLEVAHTEQAVPWLNLAAGAEVLTRQVQLIGQHSEKLYARAFSLVTLGEFDAPLRAALVEGRVGIGVLLRESGLETYREIVALGMEAGPGQQDPAAAEVWVHRTYRITRDRKPVILIRESFPWRLYEAGAR